MDIEKIKANISYHADIVVDVNQVLLHTSEGINPEALADLKKVESAGALLKQLTEQLSTLAAPQSEIEEARKFWSKIRHDMRTPVNWIKGYSEMVLEEIIEIAPDNLAIIGNLRNLISSASDILKLIDDLNPDKGASDDIKSAHDSDISLISSTGQKISSKASGSANVFARPYPQGHILVVDDNLSNREILLRRLQREGHTVTLAESGARALEEVTKHSFDLILLDLLMDNLSGFEVLLKLKSDSNYQHIPVIMVSAIGEVDSIVQCIEAGAEDYLPKPFNSVILRARIGACLEKKALYDRERAYIQQLTNFRAVLTAAIESLQDGFLLCDAKDIIINCNFNFQRLYQLEWGKSIPANFSYQDLLAHNIAKNVYSPDYIMNRDQWISARIALHDSRAQGKKDIVFTDHLADGRWIMASEYTMPDGGIVAIHKDITAEKNKQDKLRYMSRHDALTGLANRVMFSESLRETIAAAAKDHKFFAVLYVDLDGFKQANDRLGHDFGDFILVECGKRFQECVTEQDLVARLGGDEFAMIINLGTDQNETKGKVKQIMAQLFQTVSRKFERNEQSAPIGISVGIALYPSDGEAADTLVHKADEAMYASKKAGKGTYHFFSDL